MIMRSFFFLLVTSCSVWTSGPSGARPMSEDGGTDDKDSGIVLDAQVMPVVFAPMHTNVPFDMNATNLVSPTAIDTTALAIGFNGMPPTTPPKGIFFVDVGGIAVLRVGAFDSTTLVRVRGSRPLLVLAAKTISISAPIDASADLDTPGPGGATSGLGVGNDGVSQGCNSGGGGAGFGAAGGSAGAPSCMTVSAAQGGQVHSSKITDFVGGSGGGKGGGSCGGKGGAGGGAIQLSSMVAIHVIGGGSIHAGGGAGGGGCGGSGDGGGGGGGSGGTIFLEAPQVSVAGALAANGGGGGEAGASGFLWSRDGSSGTNALVDISPAPGGTSMNTDRGGGPGGARNTMAQDAANGASSTGGGGGAIGRIWIHTRMNGAFISSGKVSPAAIVDSSL